MTWDTWANLIVGDELETMIIELITLLAAFVIIGIIVHIKKEYPNLTKKGFMELMGGFLVFACHILFDLLDTLVVKKIDDVTTIYYTIFDLLDAIFSFVGLFLIGFAFLRIANYGMEIWEAEEAEVQ